MTAVSIAPPRQAADRPTLRVAANSPFAAVPPALKVTVRLLLGASLAAVISAYALQTLDLQRKSYGEGPILATVQRMRSEPVSAEWFRAPDYTLSCYGPVYYWVFDLAARLGGSRHSIIPGRLVSLAAALAIAALAAWVVRRETRSVELGLLAPLAFLVSPTVSYWMPYARVDMLALLATLGAYAVLGSKRKSVVAAAALIAAGSLVKPTCALAALPIVAHLIVWRRWRHAIVFSLVVAALGAVAWGAVQWWSRGFFLTSVLVGNRNQMIPWRGYAYGYEFLASPLGTSAMLVVVYLLVTEPDKALRS
ncbi:MAG TPA: glycosyltransferase 87 family protein, partial [Pirellulales bacterium]|nr:glycosyltransferase 87 family protein [Pirellulales bacterium]